MGFNSRPREGATWDTTIRQLSSLMFQLTPPRGGDDLRLALSRLPQCVSTHAPARGRRDWFIVCGNNDEFQLTPPRGGDPWRRSRRSSRPGFNSRPREGATRRTASTRARRGSFQLTPPRGGDGMPLPCRMPCIMFQLTPPRGGDLSNDVPRFFMDGFNSRPREGATFRSCLSASDFYRFNSRPREGATAPFFHPVAVLLVSTHAPARGRRIALSYDGGSTWFQLTPPRGGDGDR